MRPIVLLAALVAASAALAAASPAHAGFDLSGFFLAPTRGGGYIDPIAGPTRHFRVSTRAHGSRTRLRMAERFRYADGERRLQDWTIRPETGGGTGARRAYIATRPDLDGPVRFRRTGPNTYRYTWRQWFDWPRRENLVTVRGRLTRVDARTVINRATAYKGILPVASIRVRFERVR